MRDEVNDAVEPELAELIRVRAHEIWEAEGRPDGAQERNWEQARAEIEAAFGKEDDALASDDQTGPRKVDDYV